MKSLLINLFLSFVSLCSTRTAFPDLTDDNFQNECLASHNTYRAKHNTSALTVDTNIIDYAKTRCNTVSQQEMLNAGHTGLDKIFGENLFWGATTAATFSRASDAVKSWYDEISKYNYANPGFSSETGHFTQVVWKNTTRVGCARCGGKGSTYTETYIVCNCQTPGNVIGQFEANVLKPN